MTACLQRPHLQGEDCQKTGETSTTDATRDGIGSTSGGSSSRASLADGGTRAGGACIEFSLSTTDQSMFNIPVEAVGLAEPDAPVPEAAAPEEAAAPGIKEPVWDEGKRLAMQL